MAVRLRVTEDRGNILSGGTLEIRVRERKRSGAAGDTIKKGL